MSEIVLQIEDVYKQYRLGAIGGGTLQGDLQSWWAKVRGKEDPNSKIGSAASGKHGLFMALDGVSFEVAQGERLGIIGSNGAGKSTLLKLLSRITTPTKGTIRINGKIASMLEVGTGFHGELTGRENIYMNGTVLGMKRSEINRKIDDIIEFSECSQFIDTPVKRYSSGMYVRLAFAVAAHLDSDILIMDEVLAVGDMKFQQKCLGKMNDVSNNEGRTVLYVSHNMNTVRQLCSRCIVLDKGKKTFDGDVETAIGLYSERKFDRSTEHIVIDNIEAVNWTQRKLRVVSLKILNSINAEYLTDSEMVFEMKIYAREVINEIKPRFILQLLDDTAVGLSIINEFQCSEGMNTFVCRFPLKGLSPGEYTSRIVISKNNEWGTVERLDIIEKAISFEVKASDGYCENIIWSRNAYGNTMYEQTAVTRE